MRTTTRELIIGDRFCGPPGAANGGIAGGSLAALLDETAPPAAEVTLRRPVPLGRAFAARRNGDGTWVVEDGDVLVGEVRPAPRVEFAVPADVTLEQARAAAGRAPYFADPVFPGCFGCGPARRPGDGLRIFPGPIDGVMTAPPMAAPLMAAPWTPDPSVTAADGGVRPEVVWASLDCPSGIAVGAAGDLPPDAAVVLGRMTATVAASPRAGDRCRLVAWAAGRDGRKLYARSALLGPDDAVLAAADSVWLTVPRQAVES